MLIKTLFGLIANKHSLLTMWLPTGLYLATFKLFGLAVAVVVTAIYGVFISITDRERGLIPLAFCAIGIIEIIIVALVSTDSLVSALVLKSTLSALGTSLVFLCFTLIGKPIPMIAAEASSPSLKTSRQKQGVPSMKHWYLVSVIWVVGYLCKGLFWVFYPVRLESEVVFFTALLGWPTYVGLLILSILYIQTRFEQPTGQTG